MYRLGVTARHTRRRLWYLFFAVGLLALVGSIALVRHRVQHHPMPQTEVIRYSLENPSETPPTSDYNWQGTPDDPKYITIASAAIAGYLQQVGVDQHQQVAVPSNVHLAGWFIHSVRPGEKGLSIIDGHVDGRSQPGIFKALATVKTGDNITIELGSGQQRVFRVISVKTVPEKEAAATLFSQDPKVARQLNLITCTGTFDRAVGQYQDRVIVSAELIE